MNQSHGVIMNQLIEAFNSAKEFFPLQKDTEEFLAFAYLHETNWSARHTILFIEAFQMQCKQLIYAVRKLDFWQNICQNDQEILQKNNLDLYKHYLIARYFMANGGIAQMSWLLGPSAEKFYGKYVIFFYSTASTICPICSPLSYFYFYFRNMMLFL